MNPSDVTSLPAAGISTDLSIMGLFLEAHIVVQIVMIGLLVASVWSWSIIAEKMMLLATTRRETDKFEKVFWSGQSLEELYEALGQRENKSMAALFVAAMREWKRSIEKSAKLLPGVQRGLARRPGSARSQCLHRREVQ